MLVEKVESGGEYDLSVVKSGVTYESAGRSHKEADHMQPNQHDRFGNCLGAKRERDT